MMAAHRSYAMALALAASALVGAAPNGNCLPRGECIPTYPKYPDQHTLCLSAADNAWHCAALAGVWGTSDCWLAAALSA